MTQQNRLSPPVGHLIDRERPLTFNFEGRRYSGYAGDTVASALAANDAGQPSYLEFICSQFPRYGGFAPSAIAH